MATGQAAATRWWERRGIFWCLVLLAAVPLLWPDIPPLVDLPGHMGRYRVQLGLHESPFLPNYFDFRWQLIGNLGVDLLVMPLAKLLGLEPAVKLIVLAIPPLTVLGFLAVAREVHGRLPATALFALPLAYSYPFQFGFVNFALSMALAFLAFALWLKLDRLGRRRLRAAIFVPLSAAIWVAHTFGWGTLGVLAFSAELARPSPPGTPWPLRLWRAMLACLPLALPAVLMLVWRSGHVGGGTGDWFNMAAKLQWLLSVFRERWEPFDLASAALLVALLVVALTCVAFRDRRMGFEPRLATGALMLAVIFVLLPRIVFGSAYADMRLAPFMIAVAVLALRPTAGSLAKALAVIGAAFFLVRIGATTVSFAIYDRSYDRHLEALSVIPRGARVLSLVGMPCPRKWQSARLEHVPSIAIVRKDAFTNDQWVMPGAQLLRIRYRLGAPYTQDPSQMVPIPRCGLEPQSGWAETLARIPTAAFDYLWIMNVPPALWPEKPGLRPVWRNEESILYRITP